MVNSKAFIVCCIMLRANAKRCETMVHQLRGVGAHKARAPPACPPAAPARPARPG